MRQLSRKESIEISEASCQLEMNKILNKYYLQVFKVVNICDEGEQNHRYFLAESKLDLKKLKNCWIERVV
jgi:hypothetical protein